MYSTCAALLIRVFIIMPLIEISHTFTFWNCFRFKSDVAHYVSHKLIFVFLSEEIPMRKVQLRELMFDKSCCYWC